MRDKTKFLIILIQDFCNARGYTYECEKFALSLGKEISEKIEDNPFEFDFIKNKIQKYTLFLSGNNVDLDIFVGDLLCEIQRNAPYFPIERKGLVDLLNSFKRMVEGNLYKAFQVSATPKEETGRSLVQAFLFNRGFREAQMGGGNSDLILPNEKTIIETKIWHDQERYYDGLVELSEYLTSQEYSEGFYLLFDTTQKDNMIVSNKGSEIYDEIYNEHKIHCFFIKINPIAPSKKRKMMKEN